MTKVNVTHDECVALAADMMRRIAEAVDGTFVNVYGVPVGGACAAHFVHNQYATVDRPNAESVTVWFTLSATPAEADVVLTDFIGTTTAAQALQQEHGKRVFALIENDRNTNGDEYVFPWSVKADHSNVMRAVIEATGDDAMREGLAETPARLASAFDEWFSGYGVVAADVLKTFTDGAEATDEMVVLTDVPVYSHCEHHVAPIFGVAHVAYIPNGKIVGLSKIKRLVDVFAKRLQVQERLTSDIATALKTELGAHGVAVMLQCRHLCMESRGIHARGIVTTTSSLHGTFKDERECRAEFMSIVNTTAKGVI